MRAICHILRFISYATLLPYLAYAYDAKYATCMPSSDPLEGALLAGLTFLLIIGYGNTLAKKPPARDVLFWISGIVFHLLGFAAVLSLAAGWSYPFSGVVHAFEALHDAFLPEYLPYQALGAIGGLAIPIMLLWMPLAAILSMAALVINLLATRTSPTPQPQQAPACL